MLTDQKLPGYQFPLSVIGHAVWLYHRSTLSYRDVEELLFERGIEVSRESIRTWCINFSEAFAHSLRHREPRRGSQWHLDEMHVVVGGVTHWLWRAVDEQGAVLDVFLQRHRDTSAATSFFQRLLGEYDVPDTICTNQLRSYKAAIRELPMLDQVDHQRVISTARCNNLIEQSHRPTRRQERSQLGFRQVKRAQGFLDLHARISGQASSWALSCPRHQSSWLCPLDRARQRPPIFSENRTAKLEGCRAAGGLNIRPPAVPVSRLPPTSNNLPEPFSVGYPKNSVSQDRLREPNGLPII